MIRVLDDPKSSLSCTSKTQRQEALEKMFLVSLVVWWPGRNAFVFVCPTRQFMGKMDGKQEDKAISTFILEVAL